MLPYSRSSPRTASPAVNLQTNPTRTNNQRRNSHEISPYSTTPPYSDRGAEESEGEMTSRGDHTAETDQKQYQKINQVVQNFFTKAALTIVSSRVPLLAARDQNGGDKQNKWFNVVITDCHELQQQLTDWKVMDAMAGRHASLHIEIYVDIQGLGPKQALVVHDEDGKRWDVASAMNVAEAATRSPRRSSKTTQLVLERWKVQVGDKKSVQRSELSDPLPNVYKKAVVVFRSLFSNLLLMPAYRYHKTATKQTTVHAALKLKYRILNGDFKSPHVDTLDLALYPSKESATDTIEFKPTNSPVGPLSISVQYRTSCNFSVHDAESLLSSQFMGIDDNFTEQTTRGLGHAPGSLPVAKLNAQESPDIGQAYGSLSTFHQVGPPTGASPISALRAARDMPLSSPSDSPPQRAQSIQKSSIRSTDTPSYPRRTSVSFQPFKAGSLSSSPAPGTAYSSPSPVTSSGRPSSSFGRNVTPSPLSQPRNRTSMNALPQAALRGLSLPNEAPVNSSTSSSPRPPSISRYSSSFGHRRSKFSSGGASKMDEDNLSSGKGSLASSVQRGSEVNDGPGGSSTEVNRTDDENISDFLKLLESKKELQSFNRNDNASKTAAMQRTTAQLSRYQRIRDSHVALSDSVSSSTMLQPSSSSSSRQLVNVPAMITGTSVSTASSLGKPISPHTPHTPAIPSRLSANSIIDYGEPRVIRSRSRPRALHEQDSATAHQQDESADQGTDAIDIPPSLHPWSHVAGFAPQQRRNPPDEDPDLLSLRSASLPTEEVDRAHDLQRITSAGVTSTGLFSQTLASASRDGAQRDVDSRDDLVRPSSTSNVASKRGTSSTAPRTRSSFFSHSSDASLSTGATSSTERQSRYIFRGALATQDDDEPLLFQMSEIGTGSRRSLEEGSGPYTGAANKRGPFFR